MKKFSLFFGFFACVMLATDAFGCDALARFFCWPCVQRTTTPVERFDSLSASVSTRVSAESFGITDELAMSGIHTECDYASSDATAYSSDFNENRDIPVRTWVEFLLEDGKSEEEINSLIQQRDFLVVKRDNSYYVVKACSQRC